MGHIVRPDMLRFYDAAGFAPTWLQNLDWEVDQDPTANGEDQ